MSETVTERRERWRSVSIAPSAMPTRKGGAEAARVNATETRWDRDMAAYQRLRREGYQPRGIDGCAAIESRAQTPAQVEGRPEPIADGTLGEP